MPLSTNTIATWCLALLVELEKRGYEVSEAGMWSRWGAQQCVAAGHADGKWCLPTGQHPHGGLFSCGRSNSLKVRESLSYRSLTFVKEMVCYSGIAIREIMVLLQEQVTLRTSAAYTSSWQAMPASHQSDVRCEAAPIVACTEGAAAIWNMARERKDGVKLPHMDAPHSHNLQFIG